MDKHAKSELGNLAERLTKEKIKFNPFIKNYSKSEKKYLENKCRFFNTESIKQGLKKH